MNSIFQNKSLLLLKKTSQIPFGCLFILFLLNACENDIQKVNSVGIDSQSQVPAESSLNVEFLYSDSAKILSKLTAPKLDRYIGDNAYFEMIDGMEVIFYAEYPVEQSKITGDYGIGHDDGNGIQTMEARRNVVVINEKGDKLNTEQLTWNAVTKKIFTDKFVKITTKDEVIWGDGLEANQDFSEYEIKNVKGQIYINDSI